MTTVDAVKKKSILRRIYKVEMALLKRGDQGFFAAQKKSKKNPKKVIEDGVIVQKKKMKFIREWII